LRDIEAFNAKRVLILVSDFSKSLAGGLVKEIGQVDYIVHMGAETHVDKSIEDPEPFVMSNVVGTLHVLELARTLKNLERFVYFSTDEVFGPAPEGAAYKEWDRYNSANPYAASKAGGEELALAYGNTYRLPILITHTMNIFGERQHPEKFIPKCINHIRAGETVIIHSDPTRTKPGSRFWIHARNVATAVTFLLNHKELKNRDKYNIVGEKELNNLEIAQLVAEALNLPLRYELVDFHSSRPGHDMRYALDGSKLAALGWKPPLAIEATIAKTVKWLVAHERWLKPHAV
jgi:dTDP-glucose 4,6-dehydratase